jgi:type IV pilus assembly protein PilW
MSPRNEGIKQAGYTLVEIMIALALGAILLASSLEIYSTSRASWADQRLGAVVVENGRIMSQVFRSSFSNAGYYGCLPDSNSKLFIDKMDTDPDSSPYPYVHASSGVTTDLVTTYSVDNSTAVTTVAAHSLNGAEDDAQRVLSFSESTQFKEGDTVILSNCLQATAVKVKAAAESSITYLPTSCIEGDAGCTFGASTTVMKLVSRQFYAADNGRGGTSFYLRLENDLEVELVEGVQSVEFLYGLDAQTYGDGAFTSGSDGSIEQYVGREDVADWGNVIAVRVDYTISSLGNNAVERNFSTVAMIRNFRMN